VLVAACDIFYRICVCVVGVGVCPHHYFFAVVVCFVENERAFIIEIDCTVIYI
jgi:hypothetical protein